MTERQRYEVIEMFREFELRRYASHVVAEVDVEGPFAEAGNRAFGMLAAFISGRNSTSGKVKMTAPVVQEQASTRIAMTSPVVQEGGVDGAKHVVAFVMPAEYSLDTVPVPTDPRVRIREVPAEVAGARGFSGRWSEQIYQEQLAKLRSAMAEAGVTVVGPPRFARFNPPWTPPFLRRNEVVLPAADPAARA